MASVAEHNKPGKVQRALRRRWCAKRERSFGRGFLAGFHFPDHFERRVAGDAVRDREAEAALQVFIEPNPVVSVLDLASPGADGDELLQFFQPQQYKNDEDERDGHRANQDNGGNLP